MKIFNCKVFALFLLSLLVSNIAKGSNFASPIAPAEKEANMYIGGVIGFGQNMQNGSARVTCDTCSFSGGVAFGYSLGANFERQFTGDIDSYLQHFKYGAMLLYSSQSIAPAFTENSSNYFAEYDMQIPLLMKHTDNISISQLEFLPYITYNPIKNLFFRFGFSAAYLLAADMKHEVELLEKTKTLPNGEIVNVYIQTENPNRKLYNYVVEQGNIKDLHKLQFYLVHGVGFDIDLSQKLLLSTSFNYSVPLTSISNFGGENFSISTWRILLELKYNFNSDNRTYKQ